MTSPETLGHLEGREKQQSALERLPIVDISKRPEAVASALQQSQKANEIAGRIVGTERVERIQQDNPHTKHPDTLSKDPEVAKYQGILYESLGIDKNTNANNVIKRFSKGMIDGLLVGNAEIVMMIKNEGIEKFLTAIKAQFSSLEGIGQVLKALGMSVWDLATGDAYERGKSLAELGLITTGAGAVGSLSKFAGKTAIRTSVKVGGETTTRKVVSDTLHTVGRTVEVVGTGLQLPAKGVKKVVIETGKAIGVISEKTGISPALRSGARVGNEVYERSGAKKVVEGTRQAIKSTIDTGIVALGTIEAVQVVKGKIGEVLDKKTIPKEETIKTGEKSIPETIHSSEVARQIAGLEKLGFPENLARDMIESGLLNEKFLGGDLLRRFEALEKKGVDYHKMIDEAMKSIPKLSKEEALLIFSYTDETIYRKLNAFMRGDQEVLQGLTSENILSTQKLIHKLETALEKMPNLKPGKDGFVFRGDKAEYWQGAIGSELRLKDFKSVSNNAKDIFLGGTSSNDAKISIVGLEGRVKDISSLAIAVNFGDHPLTKLPKTQNEGILLPNSHVLITGKGTIEEGGKVIYQIEVKQLK